MKPDLTVWWPHATAWDSSYDPFTCSFSLKESRKALRHTPLSVQWLEYHSDTALALLLDTTAGSLILFVGDPTIVLNPYAVQQLFNRTAAPEDLPVGPVFSDGKPPQDARLPYPYWDLPTYWEVAQLVSEHPLQAPCVVPQLDPRCLLVSRKELTLLLSPARSLSLSHALHTVAGLGGVVDSAAFFHAFGPTMDRPRDELVAMVPENARRILDVGCATGLYGKNLRGRRSRLFLVGVEPDPHQAGLARLHYDRVYAQPFEQAQIEETDFDLVNCGDVLEHFADPWRALTKLHALLRPEGSLVLSVPNVGHWTVVRALLQGQFPYLPAGLLCRGHLRWFTETSLRQALEEAGFAVEVFHRRQAEPTPQGRVFLRALSAVAGLDICQESLLSEGFLVRARAVAP